MERGCNTTHVPFIDDVLCLLIEQSDDPTNSIGKYLDSYCTTTCIQVNQQRNQPQNSTN